MFRQTRQRGLLKQPAPSERNPRRRKMAAMAPLAYPDIATGVNVLGTSLMSVEAALDALPFELLSRSGAVFYTGREAFVGRRPLYILGLNPGGDPNKQGNETISRHIDAFRARIYPWSAYADDCWRGAPPGAWGMQPRVLHMLRQLYLDPRQVPASNVVFARSRDEASLKAEKARLLHACWPVHQTVIQALGVRVILCFGRTAGHWVREMLKADQLIDTFKEANARGWKSEAHCSRDGRIVATVTHPGRADWRNPVADPTEMIKRCMAR